MARVERRRRLHLGFDVGTQGTKGLLIDAERVEVVARAESSYGLIEGLPEGAAEQHPETWAAALREVTRQLLAGGALDARELAAIGVSGQQHGCVVLDERGEVVRPAKLWCDTSTVVEAQELSQRFGRSVPTGFTASKLLWLARHEPELFGRVRTVLLPHDWVNLKLTGRATMEPGDASGTAFFDVRRRQFDLVALAAIDPRLPTCLPELHESSTPAGELTLDGARFLGLPVEAVGAMVSAGGGDNMLSAIGSGVVVPGVVTLSLGTSATVFAYSATPIVDPQGAIAPFCDSTGGWLPLLCVMNATAVLEEVSAAFGLGLESLTHAAEQVEPGCGGLSFAPYMIGERVPDLPRASGALFGIRPGSLRPGPVFRAALEGVSLNLAWGVQRMRELGIAVERVGLVGGGARNPLWRAILANALEANVAPLAEPQSAALGAALQALWTERAVAGEARPIADVVAPWVGNSGAIVEPDADGVARYRELGLRFREFVERTFLPC